MGDFKMLGWMILFALLALLGAIPLLLGSAAVELSSTTAALLFGLLFCVLIVTRLVRGRP